MDYFSVCLRQSIRRTKGVPWQRDLLEESLRAVGMPGIESEARLFISNLDRGVSNEDIRVQLETYVFVLNGSCYGFLIKFTRLRLRNFSLKLES